MKDNFSLCLLAALVLCGCQDIELKECVTEPSRFVATIEDSFNGGQTRTSMNESGNILWKQGDQIGIFVGSTINEQYQVADESDGKTVAALNRVSPSGFIAGGEIDNNVAFYPYTSTASLTGNEDAYVISDIVLPSVQTYAEDSFGNGAFPMVAVTSSTADMNLKFKNVLGGLRLQLKGTATVKSISVTGNTDEVLCGAAEVTASNGNTPTVTLTDATAKTVTLTCGDGVQLDPETATSFVIALPPMTMEGGFTVIVTDTEDKQMEIKTEKPQTINRSRLLKMPAVEYVGTFPEIDFSQQPFTITSIGNTTVAIELDEDYDYFWDNDIAFPQRVNLQYRKDSGGWTTYNHTRISLSDGESVQFRTGSGYISNFSTNSHSYYSVSAYGDGYIDVSGNIMSLLDATMRLNTAPSNSFCYLFYNCTKLKDASNLILPATTLNIWCYKGLFKYCSSLESAPDLPATTLAYGCYSEMFYGCSSLEVAPDLPATTLEGFCYENMFCNCTSLTTAPALPATTLVGCCYCGMFYNCTSLTSAPVLPAGTLVNFCYESMFCNCSHLSYIKMLATTLYGNALNSWVQNVPSTGIFVKSSSATWNIRGANGIPIGWDVQTDNGDPLFAFSVSPYKKVYFSGGNLYWDGSALHFENNQYEYPTSWNSSHVGYFYWTKLQDYQSGQQSYMPYASSYSYSSRSASDPFWCGNSNKLTIDGKTGYYALSQDEWNYIFFTRANADILFRAGVTVCNRMYCLIIAPDDYTGTIKQSYSASEWADAEADGLVCLPHNGYCDLSHNRFTQYGSYYWSSTPGSVSSQYAYSRYFQFDETSDLITRPQASNILNRGYGVPIRLVRDAK